MAENYSVDYWGGFGEVANTLWLYINRDVPIIEAVGQVIDSRFEKIQFVLRQIEAAFDLDTAVGSVLDIFGAVLGLTRNGLADARYRRALKVQRSLILSSAGTRQSLLDVFKTWVGETALEYYEAHPNTITIGGNVALADEVLLLQFLLAAAPGGRQINPYAITDDDLIADYQANPLRNPSPEASGLVFDPRESDLYDALLDEFGSADGTTYDATTDAREYDGATDRLDYSGTELNATAWTLSFWARPDNVASHTQRVFSTRWASGSGSSFVGINTSGEVWLFVATDATAMQVVSGSAIPDDEWTHVTVVVDNTLTAANQIVYINGTAEAAYTTQTNGSGTKLSTAFGWHLGGRFINDTVNFDGQLADVRVWDRALSAAAALELYSNPHGITDYGLAAIADAAPTAERIR